MKKVRKWGYYEVLAQGKGWKVKRLVMSPFSKTSLQRHKYRCEFWFNTNTQSVSYISKNQWHQANNDSQKVMEIIELQFGEKCIESDIERKKDE